MAKTKNELSEGAKRALEVLQENEGSMTLAEIKESFPEVNSSHLTALRNRGLVEGTKTEKEVVSVTTRKVLVYSVVPQEEEPTEE